MRYLYLNKNHGHRDSCNPLRGLNMSRLIALQEAGERGQYTDLMWLYYYIERSDAMIHSVIQRRRAALLSLDWDVRIVSQATGSKLAEEQADFLRMVYDNIANFREAVSFLFTGFFRGFAHLEKHWTPGGLIERLEPVEQWFWLRDGLFADWEYNAGAVSGCRRGTAIRRRFCRSPDGPECGVFGEIAMPDCVHTRREDMKTLEFVSGFCYFLTAYEKTACCSISHVSCGLGIAGKTIVGLGSGKR